MKIETNFAKQLREHGITYYALSKATGVEKQTIYMWCKGKVNPTINDGFLKVCDYLKDKYGIVIDIHDFKERSEQC